MSMRMPFSRFLYVGGNNENSEKNTVSSDADSPSKVMRNVLLVFEAEEAGLSFTENCVQFADAVAEMSCDAEPKAVPSEPTREAVRFPENVEFSGNLK